LLAFFAISFKIKGTRFHQEFYEIERIGWYFFHLYFLLLNFIGFISLNISGKEVYAIVFLCRHKLNGQVYAVKIVKFNKDHDQDKVLREVKTLAKCNHNNVVRYFTT
jgi:serine/threonine protein kinase